MEALLKHPLILVTAEDIHKARQFYEINDPDRIKESLDTIEEWCQKQDHLVEAFKYFRRKNLEILFILARGSIEGTKRRIEKLFTLRGMMPELLLNRNIKEFENLWECVYYIPLPKLCPIDQSRVMVMQFLPEKLDYFNLLRLLRFIFMLGEYRFNFDYYLSERFIIDLANVNISILGKLNPAVLKKAEVLCTEGYGIKIKGIHLVNAPSFVDKILFILKQALREKVASRVHVHNTYEDLHLYIPKEILPREYGGNEQCCSKLASQWKDTLKTEEARKIIAEFENFVSNETRRDTSKFNDEYLGMPGSFRKLSVD